MQKGEPLALLFYGAMSCRAEPLQPPADYSAAVTENLMTALTSLWSLAVASYSPTVLMPSTAISLRSSSMPLAASADKAL